MKKPHSHGTTPWDLGGDHEINQARGMNLTELRKALWHSGCQQLVAFEKCLLWLFPCTRQVWPALG